LESPRPALRRDGGVALEGSDPFDLPDAESDTRLIGLPFGNVVEIGGVENDRLIGPVSPDETGGGDTVDPRHLAVDDDDVRVGGSPARLPST
jgi:hypothetical protein